MARPRVVQLQRKPHLGQISNEVVFDAVRSGLARRGRYDVSLVVSAHDNSGVLPRLLALFEARRLSRARHPDVTHVVGDVHFLVLLMRRRSTVLTIHDVEFLVRHGGAKAALYRWLWVTLPVRRSRLVTVVSEATRDDLVAMGTDPAVLRVVLNPVREVFVPAPLPQHERPVVLLMGTWPNKNLERSAQALTGLDVDVVVVGPLSDAQRALLAPLRARTLTDLDDQQVLATLHGCDLLLFPSLQEGFGLPIVEAQACGRPVVTSDRRPMSDVAGEGACLVDPEDVASIRAGVQRVLADPAYAAALVEAGLRNVERFRPEAIAAAYEAVYDEVLAGRSATTVAGVNGYATEPDPERAEQLALQQQVRDLQAELDAVTPLRRHLLTTVRRRLAAVDRTAERRLSRPAPFTAPAVLPGQSAAEVDALALEALRTPVRTAPALEGYRRGRALLEGAASRLRR